MASLIGSKVERKEDKKFLTGRGRYTADISLAHQTYAYFVRSPHARAKINKIDISKASKAPGVVKIFTGDDIAREKIGGLIAGWKILHRQKKYLPMMPIGIVKLMPGGNCSASIIQTRKNWNLSIKWDSPLPT